MNSDLRDFGLPVAPEPDDEKVQRESTTTDNWRRQEYWSAGSVATAVIQGLCVFAVAAAPIRAFLGIASVAAAAPFVHSDPVRLTLRYVGGALAVVTLWVTWDGWRLRRRPAASWRMRPLSPREKRSTWIGFVSSAVSILLIVAEVWAHGVMHSQ